MATHMRREVTGQRMGVGISTVADHATEAIDDTAMFRTAGIVLAHRIITMMRL